VIEDFKCVSWYRLFPWYDICSRHTRQTSLYSTDLAAGAATHHYVRWCHYPHTARTTALSRINHRITWLNWLPARRPRRDMLDTDPRPTARNSASSPSSVSPLPLPKKSGWNLIKCHETWVHGALLWSCNKMTWHLVLYLNIVQ